MSSTATPRTTGSKKSEVKASAVILGHRRLGNLPKVIASLSPHSFVDECVVWLNDPSPEILKELADFERFLPPGWLRVKSRFDNSYTWARFRAAKCAKNDLILSCDDDVLVHQWQEIYDRHLATGRLTAVLDRGHADWAATRYVHEYAYGKLYETLLGWGSAWRQSWINPVFQPYVRQYGLDEVMIRKADRLFPMLLRQPHEIIVSAVVHLPGADSEDCLSSRNDHWSMNRTAYARAKELASKNLTPFPLSV